MHAVIITGAPGVGKTALLDELVETLPGRRARLDGDHVAAVRAYTLDRWRQDLIQDTICACAKGFVECGVDYFIMGVWQR
jgi:Ni2+-binding GTPase involved in maturation of urease and hydrogenase